MASFIMMSIMKCLCLICVAVSLGYCNSKIIGMKHWKGNAPVKSRRSIKPSLNNISSLDPDTTHKPTTSKDLLKNYLFNTQRNLDFDEFPTFLIFSGGSHISSMQLSADVISGDSIVKEIVLINGLRCATFLDYFWNYDNSYIFWSDLVEKKIYKAVYSNTGLKDISVVVPNGLGTIKGLAVDWIGEHIYWLDSKFQKIEVSLLNGSMRTLLLSNISQAQGLALDPIKQLLFWTNFNPERPGIVSCDLSGFNMKIILQLVNLEDSHWPNDMTLDYTHQLIFWVGGRSGSIWKADYHGNNVEMLFQNRRYGYPFSVGIYRETLLWSDHFKTTISSFNMETTEANTLTVVYPTIYSLKVFHPSRQVNNLSGISNPCQRDINNCSHICLLEYPSKAVCTCPYGMILAPDNRTCNGYSDMVMYSVEELHGTLRINHIPDQMLEVFPSFSISENPVFGVLAKRHFFWISGQIIHRLCLDTGKSISILELAHLSPKIIAIDFKEDVLYIISAFGNDKSEVSVCSSSGEYFTPLHWLNMYEPSSLMIDSGSGLLFWSHNRQLSPEEITCLIESSLLDGSERKHLFTYYTSSKVNCPKSLVSLSSLELLCWLTTFEIQCMSLNGNHSKVPFNLTSSFKRIISMGNHINMIYYVIEDDGVHYINVSSNVHHSNYLRKLDQASQIFGVVSLLCDKALPSWNNGIDFTSNCLSNAPMAVTSYPLVRGINRFLLTSTDSGLQTIALDNCILPIIFPFPIFYTDIEKFEYDVARSTVYFIDKKSGCVQSSRQDGKLRQEIIAANENVTSFALDWISGNIYWASASSHAVKMSRANGKYPVTIVRLVGDKISEIDVDPKNGYLFWAECCISVGIKVSSLSGSDKRSLVTENILSINDLAADSDSLFLYWVDGLAGTVERVKFDGSQRHLLVVSSRPFSVGVGSQHFYWTERNADEVSIYFSDKSRMDQTLLKNNLTGSLRKLQIVDTKVTEGVRNPCVENNGGCEQLCFFYGKNNFTCGCSFSILNPDGKSCSSHTSFLLMAHGSCIESFSLHDPVDADSPMPCLSPSPSMHNTLAVAVDTQIERVFFSDMHHPPYLFSMDLHGEKCQPLLKDNKLREVESLMYNNLDKYLYWTDGIYPSVCRIYVAEKLPKESGEFEMEIIIELEATDKPRGLALHICSSTLFWTNWKEEYPTIERAFLNGSSRQIIINTNLSRPNGLTVDSRTERLFWADAKYDDSYILCFSNLDGSYVHVIDKGTNHHPFDVAVYKNLMFWTDWKNGSLMLTDWVSGDGPYVVRSGFLHPMGLAIADDQAIKCSWNTNAIDHSFNSIHVKCCNQSTLPVNDKYGGYSFHFALMMGLLVAVLFSFSALFICKSRWTPWNSFRSWFPTALLPVRDINQESITSPLFDEVYYGHQQLITVSPCVNYCTPSDKKSATDTDV